MTSLEPERVEPTPRRIRVHLGGHLVADSRRALLLIQYGPNGLPTYFLPRDDVVPDVLTDEVRGPDGQSTWGVRAGHAHVHGAAWTHPHPELAGHVTFSWRQLEWSEEDEQVFVHALDPYKRADTRHSSQRVEIRVGGETVARSIRPVLLFETSLPTRYYLPFEDVRTECLEPSDMVSMCPYKGRARYWSVRGGGLLVPDAMWSYPDPVPAQRKIAGLACFFTERVDLVLDGVPQPRTVSPWSDETSDVIDRAADR